MSSPSQLHGASFTRALMGATMIGSPLIGLLVLVGWAWGVPAAKSVVPGLSAMAPNTALGLILAGVSLGLLHPRAPGPVRRTVGRACAWGLILIGTFTLLEELLDPELGFEDVLFQWTDWASQATTPLTAPTTASSFILLGAALLLLGRRTALPAYWTDTPITCVMLVALFELNGRLHGALAPRVRTASFLPEGMGLHTSVMLMLLAASTLCARPERGLVGQLTRDTLGGFLARRLVPVSILGPTVVGVVLELFHREGIFSLPTKAALFSTVMSLGGVAIVFLSAQALNRIDSERRQANVSLRANLEGLRVARAEAEQERALLEAVVEHAPVGILFLEPSTNEVRLNSALQAMLGSELPFTERHQYLGRLRHVDGKPVRFEELPSTQALEGHESPPERYLIIRSDRQVPVIASAAPVRGDSGEIRGVIVCIQDISTHEELERLREEYVGLISHDLRTPLQNILLRSQLLLRSLREKGLTAETAAAEALLRNTRWMSGMVEELLEGSRLESGQVELHREPLDLTRFIEEVIERDVPPDARERLRLEVVAPVPSVPADAPRVERVMVNLITNALKYGTPGTPIVVRLEQQNGSARISVRDQGPGLLPEEAERLFTKYYRTREGRRAEGVGLGLYISRLIIEAHGGHIQVESTPGQGATFRFTLPLTAPTRGERAQPQSS